LPILGESSDNSSPGDANISTAVLIDFAVYHPARLMPSTFLPLRLHKRRLEKIDQSSPPNYFQVENNIALTEEIPL
jgi:hypothetical protein